MFLLFKLGALISEPYDLYARIVIGVILALGAISGPKDSNAIEQLTHISETHNDELTQFGAKCALLNILGNQCQYSDDITSHVLIKKNSQSYDTSYRIGIDIVAITNTIEPSQLAKLHIFDDINWPGRHYVLKSLDNYDTNENILNILLNCILDHDIFVSEYAISRIGDLRQHAKSLAPKILNHIQKVKANDIKQKQMNLLEETLLLIDS